MWIWQRGNALRNQDGVPMITQSGCGIHWPFPYLVCSQEGHLHYSHSISSWLISPYFRDRIDCLAHTAYFPVCLQGKTSSYCLGPCHLGLSSWSLLQLLYPVHPVSSKGALGFHSSCFAAHRSQVRCEFLVTFCCGDCKIKIQLLKQIRGETDEGPCLNHTSHRQFYQWHS